MSGSAHGETAPSAWAVERFCRLAGALVNALPVQLVRAHARARAAHLKPRVTKRGPYGSTLSEAVRENLADLARELGETARDVRGYEYAVINEHALFPLKYGNRPCALHLARVASSASPTRRRLLCVGGTAPSRRTGSSTSETT
ncbi:hypothetical protein ACWGIB_12040 [Streptomyces xiamenensis]